MIASTSKLTQDQIHEIPELVKKKMTDSEIANYFGGVSDGAIFYWRKKLGIKTQFTYEKNSKIDHSELIRLFNEGLSDYKIAKILGVKPCSIFSYRKKHNIGLDRNLKFAKSTTLSHSHIEILVGCVMGDGSMRREYTNAKFVCMHGIKQKNYCEYKHYLLRDTGAKLFQHKRNKIDKRTGLYYEDCSVSLPCNPELNFLYDAFYSSGEKHIPFSLLEEYYTAQALAIHFMDDGYKTSYGYSLATQSFNRDEVINFSLFLNKRFNLNTTVHKSNTIYIKSDSADMFRSIVSPYFIDSMRYKL